MRKFSPGLIIVVLLCSAYGNRPAQTSAVASLALIDSGQRLGAGCSWDVALGDLDGDHDLDAFVANSAEGEVGSAVWLNDGQGIFTRQKQDLGYGMSLSLGDLDGDGDLDIFVTHGELGKSTGGGLPNEVWLNEL